MLLSTLADATIMTVRWGTTPRFAVAAAVKKLAAMGRPAHAAVFSHVDLRRGAHYPYAIESERYFTDLKAPRSETDGQV